MKHNQERRSELAGERLAVLANHVVKICGCAIFLFLTWYSFRYTQYMNPGGDEIPVNVQDSMSRNLLALFLAAAVFLWLVQLERQLSERLQKLLMRGTLIFAMVWITGLGFWWITSAERMPEGDQAFVYGGASYFLEGNYAFLGTGGYCDMYPHQLALIALMELLFLFAGKFNYFAFQVICVLFSAGIVYIGYQLVRCMTDRMSGAVAYCIAMMGCFPLVFYTSWVYGDIPSIFFTMLGAWMLMCYSEKRDWRYLAAVVAALTLAVLVRKNSLIMVIAFCLVAGVWALQHRDKRVLAAAFLSLALPMLLYAGIYKMYEVRSGYAHSRGLPAVSWIAMGMQESSGRYGWYYDYPKKIYENTGYDFETTEAVVKQDLKDSMKSFLISPEYAYTFFREKILSQWNEPLYQSLFFTTKYREELRPPEDSFVLKISGEYFTKILWVCDRLQFILYFGMLLYFLLEVRGRSGILQHMLAVSVIGGFLFSILWEAKARYVLPYYVIMFSLSAVGYLRLSEKAAGLFGKSRGSGQDKMTPFKRAA